MKTILAIIVVAILVAIVIFCPIILGAIPIISAIFCGSDDKGTNVRGI